MKRANLFSTVAFIFSTTAVYAASPQVVLNLINQNRSGAGLAPLAGAQNIDAVAWYHSKDMCDRNFFDHVNPSGQDAAARLTARAVPYQGWGENIYWGTGSYASEGAAVQWWMNSAGHRANILGSFNQIGIGIYDCPSNGRTLYTTVFVLSGGNNPTPPPSTGGRYGAIAFSPSTTDYGRSWNWGSQAEAENSALDSCRRGPHLPQDCKVGVWMRDACGAIAVGNNGRWGWAWNAQVQSARDAAVQSCGGYGVCNVLTSVCTDGSGQS